MPKDIFIGHTCPDKIRSAAEYQKYNIQFLQTLTNNHKIDNISNRWKSNPVTDTKTKILQDFVAYIKSHQAVKPSILVKNWLEENKQKYHVNPLQDLQEHRGFIKHFSLFSRRKATSSIKILDDYIRNFDRQAHENLSTVVSGMKA